MFSDRLLKSELVIAVTVSEGASLGLSFSNWSSKARNSGTHVRVIECPGPVRTVFVACLLASRQRGKLLSAVKGDSHADDQPGADRSIIRTSLSANLLVSKPNTNLLTFPVFGCAITCARKVTVAYMR